MHSLDATDSAANAFLNTISPQKLEKYEQEAAELLGQLITLESARDIRSFIENSPLANKVGFKQAADAFLNVISQAESADKSAERSASETPLYQRKNAGFKKALVDAIKNTPEASGWAKPSFEAVSKEVGDTLLDASKSELADIAADPSLFIQRIERAVMLDLQEVMPSAAPKALTEMDKQVLADAIKEFAAQNMDKKPRGLG